MLKFNPVLLEKKMISTTLFYKNNSHPIIIFLKITFSLILIKEKEFI